MSTVETRYVGRPVRRREDPRLITGRGRYLADLRLPGCLEAAFVRSTHAHARVVACDVERARTMPGVVAAFSGADLQSLAPALLRFPLPALAWPEARFVGEPVAVVVATDRYAAEDAADVVEVVYEDLPAVVDLERALQPGAPRATAADTNVAVRYQQHVGDVDGAFAAAEVVVRRRLLLHRNSGFPLECRAVAAAPDIATGGLTVWATNQGAHRLRDRLAGLLDLPDRQLRVLVPGDVGGGFGVKNGQYAEDLSVAWAALRLGRPVRWIEDRREHFLACNHERETVMDLALAARRDGTILGLRAALITDTGPYPRSPFIGGVALTTMPGPYRVPAYDGVCHVVYTNKTPTGPYRGAGRPQGNFAMERLMDGLAEATGLDRAEVRRRNLVPPEQMPYDTGMVSDRGAKILYDSGDYPEALDRLLATVDMAGFRRRQAEARAAGRHLGLGLVCYNEDAGGGFEGARLRLDATGRVVAYMGSACQGQGHETAYAQVAADALGVDPGEVTIVHSDTAGVPAGTGTFGSRSTQLAASAVARASAQLAVKIRAVAGLLLEASPDDLELAAGAVRVKGAPSRSVPLRAVAAAAGLGRVPQGADPVIEETVYFRSALAFPYGVQAAEVEVDPETGRVEMRRCVMVHDCGRLINPMIVEGQIHGGVLHGVGDALYSELVHDGEGQLLTASFMDYLLPTSSEMPRMEISHTETPSPLNPLGVKGVGEAGTTPTLAALAAAVEDALRPFGVTVTELPLTPRRIRELITAGTARG